MTGKLVSQQGRLIVAGVLFAMSGFALYSVHSHYETRQIISFMTGGPPGKYLYVPYGTSGGELLARLGPPAITITNTPQLEQICADLSHSGYLAPQRKREGRVLYYCVAGNDLRSYQIFYYLGRDDKLLFTFIGRQEPRVPVHSAHNLREAQSLEQILRQAKIPTTRINTQLFVTRSYKSQAVKLLDRTIRGSSNRPR